jgi:DNA-binding transcriptional MerR regulator
MGKARMKIGDAAGQAGVTARTLRYYEELGLIESVKHGAQREFTGFHVTLVQHITQLKQLGFSLEEIRQVMALKKVLFAPDGAVRRAHGRIPLSRKAVRALQDKTARLQRAIAEQQELLERLGAFLDRSLKGATADLRMPRRRTLSS